MEGEVVSDASRVNRWGKVEGEEDQEGANEQETRGKTK